MQISIRNMLLIIIAVWVIVWLLKLAFFCKGPDLVGIFPLPECSLLE